MSAIDAVNATSTGIAMGHVAVDFAEQRTSGYGTFRKSGHTVEGVRCWVLTGNKMV